MLDFSHNYFIGSIPK
uniref:Uncharacterized protein n=1 Tax=Rhizophora mucronata TaxID=61149 RepID=A0A2P2Q6A0_RHIMU